MTDKRVTQKTEAYTLEKEALEKKVDDNMSLVQELKSVLKPLLDLGMSIDTLEGPFVKYWEEKWLIVVLMITFPGLYVSVKVDINLNVIQCTVREFYTHGDCRRGIKSNACFKSLSQASKAIKAIRVISAKEFFVLGA